MAIGQMGFGAPGEVKATGKSNDQTYYSRFKVRSADGKRNLSITYWNGLMIFEINDIDNSNGFRSTALETIRLSPAKANLLYIALTEFKEYLEKDKIEVNKAFGVTSGLGAEVPYIGFSAMDNENKDIVLTIGKINNSGTIISSHTFVFDNTEYLYTLYWNDITKMEVERGTYHHLELDMIMDGLKAFAQNMNGAVAYSVLDMARYDNIKINKRFDALYDKLGIEKFVPGNGGYNGGNRGNNFLNNLASNNRSSNSTSIDDLGELLDD